MTIWKIRRVLVEVQECTVVAERELDAAILGKHESSYNLVNRQVTVFDTQPVGDTGPTDPDMRT